MAPSLWGAWKFVGFLGLNPVSSQLPLHPLACPFSGPALPLLDSTRTHTSGFSALASGPTGASSLLPSLVVCYLCMFAQMLLWDSLALGLCLVPRSWCLEGPGSVHFLLWRPRGLPQSPLDTCPNPCRAVLSSSDSWAVRGHRAQLGIPLPL